MQTPSRPSVHRLHRQPLQAALAGRALSSLSSPVSGVICDRGAMTCFVRSGPSIELTRQQLGNGALCRVANSTCWTNARKNRVDKEVSKSRGLCSLSQRGRAIFDGPCDLRIVSGESGRVRRYAISTEDGRRYVLRRQGKALELEDATGSYSVDFRDHGYTGLFRWSDIVLVVTREHRRLPRSRSGGGDQGGQIDQLFSPDSN